MTIALSAWTQAAKHVGLHVVLCFLGALVLGWGEMQIRTLAYGPGSANEFVGMYFVVWLYFIAPVSCVLAAPLHALAFFWGKAQRHVYSAAASLVACVGVWALLTR